MKFQRKTKLVQAIAAGMLTIAFSLNVIAGNLEPSGVPGPTMKPLNDLEPRTGIPPQPIIITEPGSYYLLYNIDMTAETGTTAITISVSDVTIDLNGYTIRGPGKNAPGWSSGIYAANNVDRVTVLNGSVRGWPGYGIQLLGRSSRIKDVKCVANGYDGINVGENSNVSGCYASNNGDDGIHVGKGSLITDCAAYNNIYGIYAPNRTIISNCVSDSNTATGIIGNYYSTIRDCTANLNGNVGIAASTGAQVINNSCERNGDTDIDAGIYIANASAGGRVEGNNVADNHYGIYALSTRTLIIKNHASGNTIDYSIVAGNKVGPIVSDPAATTNPWANFKDAPQAACT